MPTKVSDLGLWDETAPKKVDFPIFAGGRKADVAVVGGGYTGLSAALHLSVSGVDVCLLEANRIGHGGSGRNVGLVNAGLWMFPDDVAKALGKERGERLLSVLGGSPELVYGLIDKYGMDCEAVRKGTLHCAHSASGYRALQARLEQWGRRGVNLTLFDKAEAASKIGSDAFHGALLDLRAGTVQPLAYAYGLAEAAATAGATLFCSSPVISLERTSDQWRLKTAKGVLTAKSVILAGGGYIQGIRKELGKTFIPFNFFQFSTQPLPEQVRKTILPGGHGAWDTALVLSSFRLDKAGRLIVGSVGMVDKTAFRLHRDWTKRTLSNVFPQVGRVELQHAWHGRIAMTTDHIPRFYTLDKDLAMVTNYNGRGIGPGTVFGKLMADYMIGGDPDTIPLPRSTAAPLLQRGLMGAYYEAGARLYHFVQRRI